jgi:hypothetical protein
MGAFSAFVLGLGFPGTAHAEVAVNVTMTRITQDAAGLTVTGSVTSTGDKVDSVEVILWRDGPRLASPTDLDAVLASDADSAFTSSHVEPTKYTLTTQNISAGVGPFTLHATWAQLGMPNNGVYLVGVDVRAPGADPSAQPLARERTLVTVSGNATVSVATVVELTSTPSLLHGAVFLDEHLVREFSGRLGSLVELAQGENVSWAIDPLLYHEVSVMASGYEVLVDGQLNTGRSSVAAQEWLAKVDALPKSAGYRLPWGNPDLGLAESLDEDAVAEVFPFDAVTLPQSLATLPLLVRAHDGRGDSAWLDVAETLQPAIVLVSAAQSGTLAAGVLVASPAAVRGMDGSSSTVQMTALRAAEDYIYGPALSRIVDDPGQAQISVQGEVPVLLSDLANNVSQPMSLSVLTGPTNPILTAASMDAATYMGGGIALYESLTDSHDVVRQLVASQRLAALSQSWGSDSDSQTYTQAVADWVTSLPQAVTLTAPPNVTLTSRTGSFLVTITNKSPAPVYVKVASSSSSPLALTIPTTDIILVNAGDKVPAVLAPRVTRDGDTEVLVWLETSAGERIGAATTIPISATQTAWLAWVIIGSAVLLVVVGTGLRVRTMAKARANQEPRETQEPQEPRESGESQEPQETQETQKPQETVETGEVKSD